MTRRAALLIVPTLLLMAQDGEPWKESDLIQPAALAAMLKESGGKPAIVYVGFPVLYRGAHIPGAVLAGPVSKPEGVESLKQAVASLPKDGAIVLYCGCCPFTKCPNVRPAFRMLREMGYSKVKLVVIPTNLHTDWIEKGYPIEKAAGASGS
jgi:thiosulfate/3-mercaptopyruvate sulfurtransferase